MNRRVVKFDRTQEIPVVRGVLSGKHEKIVVKLAFDSGAGLTQFHTPIIEALRYSITDALEIRHFYGPTGETQSGYTLAAAQFEIFGIKFPQLVIGAYDMENLVATGIDGLLGFDLIKQMHFEMNGPQGELTVFT